MRWNFNRNEKRGDAAGYMCVLLAGKLCWLCDQPQSSWNLQEADDHLVILSGELLIDLEGSMVWKSGRPTDLTRTEFEIVRLLACNASMLCTREVIGAIVEEYSNRVVKANTLSKDVHRIRCKLQDNDEYEYIHTRHGFGYQWCCPVKRYYMLDDPYAERIVHSGSVH